MTKLTKEVFIESLKRMSLLEIKILVDGLKEEFGIDPSASLALAGNGADSAAVVEEQTEFRVILKNFGSSKINVIKMIREITGLGLVDAKNLTETPDATVKKNVSKDEAEKIKTKLEALGAKVELK
ncbi:50S ribosomal protein L7/L12 [Candidatus Phytoplasma pruni]|uniref:Large ribosomal subunit protein bL12 n=1 Tax=Candidatus Phytoplasma pruni TaxID=479893 RepID=A0A0M1N0E6_9MOLU|nr:50S ribosomal protein L7/L12 [Candidatus Phytoplasma pruni]KOR75638.1 50S ribosomal protein L7/L12 [Candidatus Phytoplasma pruni]